MKGAKMRLLLCGGGTAGHISPAIAVAEEMKKSCPDAKILFVGRVGGRENEIIEKEGFKLRTIKIMGLRRSFSIDNIKRVITALKAKSEAEKIIKEFKPDVILGTGGYVCWPVISAGRKLGIPVAIHESNTSPGLTTKLLAKKCDKVLLNHIETKKYLNDKTKISVVGNPIKEDFYNQSRKKARQKLGLSETDFFILSFGGSIGAEEMNKTIIEVMEKFSAKEKTVKHIHGAGQRYFNKIKSRYTETDAEGCRILPYINDMPFVLSAADLVICRCGAMTLSELSAIGIASILIPSPNVSDNHQFKNAKRLCDRNAATLIEEKNLSAKELINAIISLKNDKNARKSLAKNIKQLSTPLASKDIVKELFLLKKQ